MGPKRETLAKMLSGKSHAHVCIYIESGAAAEPACPSKVAIKIRDDLLMINDMIPIPIDDRYIACLEDDFAEIVFIDPDHQIVHVKILTDFSGLE
ncbi:hypothetical protein [Pelotomaculum propionicicum]|uniref:Uncharacterized protein n=1 Tax=Pelotomaculum propionicicum TaxID=258475 RepID=A0A4Y7RPT7_9FIRM|nr:hypothetical protein [Pelotomaculum propionicicum]NLI13900.1 hypothetical protein [Peptococcaceae bacterium]TEB11028.1 hypothetical protein Pmgp_01900 [Pelotomaculum propionicicum]